MYRHVLDDSDLDSDGGGGPSAPAGVESIFTAKEKEAIERCNIQINNGGKYSEDIMTRSIAALGEPPLEMVNKGASFSHERYCVRKGQEKDFFGRDIYMVHDPTPVKVYDVSSSEEDILLQIEAIRRSAKSVKNRMIKQKETGGMVVFGPWWIHALTRVMDLSSDENVDAKDLGEYTSVKILRALFGFITEGMGEIIKPGKSMMQMKTRFNIDWEYNVKTARKVIDKCGGSSHLLDAELSAVENYLESLKAEPAAYAAAKPASQNGAAAASTTAAKRREHKSELMLYDERVLVNMTAFLSPKYRAAVFSINKKMNNHEMKPFLTKEREFKLSTRVTSLKPTIVVRCKEIQSKNNFKNHCNRDGFRVGQQVTLWKHNESKKHAYVVGVTPCFVRVVVGNLWSSNLEIVTRKNSCVHTASWKGYIWTHPGASARKRRRFHELVRSHWAERNRRELG